MQTSIIFRRKSSYELNHKPISENIQEMFLFRTTARHVGAKENKNTRGHPKLLSSACQERSQKIYWLHLLIYLQKVFQSRRKIYIQENNFQERISSLTEDSNFKDVYSFACFYEEGRRIYNRECFQSSEQLLLVF
jgi:hypothetical protein